MSIAFAILFLLAALFSLAELLWQHGRVAIESYIADREAQATHVLMNGGMAMMAAPFHDASIERGLIAAFGAGVAILATRLIWLAARRSPTKGPRIAGTVYHLLGLAAMLYAMTLMPAGARGVMAMQPGALATALGVAFLLDGVATLILAGFLPRTLLRMESAISVRAAVADRKVLTLIRASAFPHVVMDLGMAAMLFAIL